MPHHEIADDEECHRDNYEDTSSTGGDCPHPSGREPSGDNGFSDDSDIVFGLDNDAINNRIDHYADTDAYSTESDDDTANNDSDHVDMDAGISESEHGQILTREEILELQRESWVEPTIRHYPGNRAGEVCSKGITIMQEYENTLGTRPESAYSPFNSKIDWELAKWAKLRGPSATSFTELLNISGVSSVNKSPSASISGHLYPATRTTQRVIHGF